MNWYKTSQDFGKKIEIVNKILHGISAADKYFIRSDTGMIDGYIEYRIQDVYGTAYINVSYSEHRDKILIEKYYESEFLHDQFGTSQYIDVNYDNPDETVNNINSAVLK